MLPDDCLILQSAGFYCTQASQRPIVDAGQKRPMHRTICEQPAPQHITT
jgi:hypothetical protein